jgi:hypothetical protein
MPGAFHRAMAQASDGAAAAAAAEPAATPTDNEGALVYLPHAVVICLPREAFKACYEQRESISSSTTAYDMDVPNDDKYKSLYIDATTYMWQGAFTERALNDTVAALDFRVAESIYDSFAGGLNDKLCAKRLWKHAMPLRVFIEHKTIERVFVLITCDSIDSSYEYFTLSMNAQYGLNLDLMMLFGSRGGSARLASIQNLGMKMHSLYRGSRDDAVLFQKTLKQIYSLTRLPSCPTNDYFNQWIETYIEERNRIIDSNPNKLVFTFVGRGTDFLNINKIDANVAQALPSIVTETGPLLKEKLVQAVKVTSAKLNRLNGHPPPHVHFYKTLSIAKDMHVQVITIIFPLAQKTA